MRRAGQKSHIHKDANNGIDQNKYPDHNNLNSEFSNFKYPVILCQNAKLDEPNRDRIDHLVCIPMFERGYKDHRQVQVFQVLAGTRQPGTRQQ